MLFKTTKSEIDLIVLFDRSFYPQPNNQMGCRLVNIGEKVEKDYFDDMHS